MKHLHDIPEAKKPVDDWWNKTMPLTTFVQQTYAALDWDATQRAYDRYRLYYQVQDYVAPRQTVQMDANELVGNWTVTFRG